MSEALRVSPLLKAAFVFALLAALAGGAFAVAGAVGTEPGRPALTDYHAFHIVGGLATHGELADAYRASVLRQLESALGGGAFMPWSYPPTYAFLAAPLNALGLVSGFLLFSAGSLALYVAAMRRLGGESAWPVLLASFVGVALNLRSGQNGLLTGGLAALVASAVLQARNTSAGLGLAALSLKPHLVLLVPFELMRRRCWIMLCVAVTGTAALTGAALLVFGCEAFTAFFASLPDVGRMMSAGVYPLHRMTSIYACALSFGVPSPVALLLHAMAASVVLGAAGRIVWRSDDPRLALGAVLIGGLFVSPYVYDYDQPIFGVALLLLAPALIERVGTKGYRGLLIGWALAQSLGLVINTVVADGNARISLMGPPLLLLSLIAFRVISRQPDAQWQPLEAAG